MVVVISTEISVCDKRVRECVQTLQNDDQLYKHICEVRSGVDRITFLTFPVYSNEGFAFDLTMSLHMLAKNISITPNNAILLIFIQFCGFSHIIYSSCIVSLSFLLLKAREGETKETHTHK